MGELVASYKKGGYLHHAYFLVGDGEEIFSELKDFLENKVGVKTSSNPDFWYGKFNSLTIDEARHIAESSERKDFSNNKKIFIIQVDFISQEAQNSLLKVFEEPTPNTHFFIISPQDMLLPTLRSRMVVIQSENQKSTKSTKFLNLKLSDRLIKVKEITDAISDEEKTKQDAITLLNQIETELHYMGAEKSAKALEICESTRASLYDRGAPIKIILENLMLSI